MHQADEKQARLLRFQRAWQAYLAEMPDALVTDTPANDNVKTNPARAMINTSVYFLFGHEVQFEVSPNQQDKLTDPGGATSTEEEGTPAASTPDWLRQLNQAWKANRKQSLLNRIGTSGAIHGHCFIKFVPNGAGLNNEFPRMVLLDPANVNVKWDPDDCEEVEEFDIEYMTEGPDGKPVLHIQKITPNEDDNDVVHSWTLQDYVQEADWMPGTGWVPGLEQPEPVGPPVEWPYSWPPIENCQNMEIPNQFWGLPDIDDASVDVIMSLQRSMSSVNKIVRIHGSPRLFAKGVMPEQVDEIDVSADNIVTLPGAGPETDLKVVEPLTNIDASTNFTDKLREDLYEMLQVPPIALGKVSTASMNMSGASLSILYAPILQKTELKRISYGDMLERINYKLLVLMGEDPQEAMDSLSIVWPESMPGSDYLERQTLQQDHAMGASMYTILARLGYDPDLEQTRRQAELEAAVQEAVANGGQGMDTQSRVRLNSAGSLQDDTITSKTAQPTGVAPNAPNNPSRVGGAGATGNSTPKSPTK